VVGLFQAGAERASSTAAGADIAFALDNKTEGQFLERAAPLRSPAARTGAHARKRRFNFDARPADGMSAAAKKKGTSARPAWQLVIRLH